MINAVVESTAKEIFKGILQFLFHLLVELVLFYSGEIFLFFATVGKRRPRWNYYVNEPLSKFVIFTEISTWIGFAFWLFVAWIINSVFLN